LIAKMNNWAKLNIILISQVGLHLIDIDQ